VTTSSNPTGRITREQQGHLLLMGIDRVDKRNAFGPEMIEQLCEAYGELEQTPDLRCGVLFAHGDHFTAGLDLLAVAPRIARGQFIPPDAANPWGTSGPARTKPVVIAVQGLCLTLGIELILAADVCVAASNARFGQIEVKRGIFPFGGATVRFVPRAGWGNAMRYLLTGDEFDAAEAYRIGLVQEVVAPGEQLTRAIAIAETIAAQAPLAVQATLAAARLAQEAGPQAAMAQLLPQLLALLKTDDAREGLMSFVERRAAQFQGK
jgi:enoyl-CoA hydratase/carnithine racemase